MMYLEIFIGKPNYGVIFRIDFFVFISVQKHSYSSDDEESSKNIHYPAELGDQCCSHKNEDETHDNSTQNPPEQHPMIISFCNTESREYQYHYKYIIHRKSVLNNITGEIF